MNKLIKGTLLFTALVLPILIFVFLKIFGENTFDIPVFNHVEFSEGMNCGDIRIPHVVANLKTEKGIVLPGGITNIYHVMLRGENSSELKGLMKVKDRLESEKVEMHTITPVDSISSVLRERYQINGIWEVYEANETDLNDFVNCDLMIAGSESIVLVDEQARIRGYYNGKDEEEIDRLILEAKILFSENENS